MLIKQQHKDAFLSFLQQLSCCVPFIGAHGHTEGCSLPSAVGGNGRPLQAIIPASYHGQPVPLYKAVCLSRSPSSWAQSKVSDRSVSRSGSHSSFSPAAGMVVVGDLLASHYSCVAVIPRRPKRVVEPGWTLTPLSCPPPAMLQVEVALSKAYTCRNISWANFSYIFQFSVPFYQNGLPSVVPGRFTHPFTLTPEAPQHTYLQGSGAYNSNCPSVLSHQPHKALWGNLNVEGTEFKLLLICSCPCKGEETAWKEHHAMLIVTPKESQALGWFHGPEKVIQFHSCL